MGISLQTGSIVYAQRQSVWWQICSYYCIWAKLVPPTARASDSYDLRTCLAAATDAWMISEGERRLLYLRNQVTETNGLVTIQILYNCIYLLLTIARLARWCVMNIVFVLELMFVSYTLHHFLYLSLYRCQYVPFCVHHIHVIIHLVILIWPASLHLYHFYFHMEYLHRFTWLLYFFISIFTVREDVYPICVLLRGGQ